jgi:hypothetical protein
VIGGGEDETRDAGAVGGGMSRVERHVIGDIGVVPGVVREGRAVGEVDHRLDVCDDIAPAAVGPVGEVALHKIDRAIPGELA